MLLGLVLTLGAGLLSVREQGVYFTRMEVVFLAPASWYPNVLQTTPESVIVAAGAVVKRVVGPSSVIRYGSAEANLVGITRDREGTWVRLADSGGQWVPGYGEPIIVVDILAGSEERARVLQGEALASIKTALVTLEDEWKFDRAQAIAVTVSPESSVVYRVRGDRIRALGMTTLLGGAATIGAVVVLESRARRRSLAAGGVRAIVDSADDEAQWQSTA